MSDKEIPNKNKEYYIANKTRLQGLYKSRVKCPLCDKDVAKASLNTHMKSRICEKGQQIKIKILSNQNLIFSKSNNIDE